MSDDTPLPRRIDDGDVVLRAWTRGDAGDLQEAIVTSVAVDEGSGRVRGVTYLKGGQEYFQPADVVLLAGKRTVSQIAISQFQTAPPAKLEQVLGKLVARRMGVTPSA